MVSNEELEVRRQVGVVIRKAEQICSCDVGSISNLIKEMRTELNKLDYLNLKLDEAKNGQLKNNTSKNIEK